MDVYPIFTWKKFTLSVLIVHLASLPKEWTTEILKSRATLLFEISSFFWRMKCRILIFSCGKAVNSSVAYHYSYREKRKLVRSSLCHNLSWVNSTSSSKRLFRQDLSLARHMIIVRTSLVRVPFPFGRPPYYNSTQSRKRRRKCGFF